jgi:hypothetical protein
MMYSEPKLSSVISRIQGEEWQHRRVEELEKQYGRKGRKKWKMGEKEMTYHEGEKGRMEESIT